MAKKIKLSDAAKDLNITSQELIDFFAEKGDNKKKTGSSLTEDEMDLILESYTKANEVKSLDDYFASKNEPKPEKIEPPKQEKKKPAAPKKDEKPAPKKENAPAPKKEEKPAAPAPKKEEAPKKNDAPKAEPKKEEPKPVVKEETPAPKAEEKPAAPVQEQKAEAPAKQDTHKNDQHKKKDKKKSEPAKAQDRGERTKFNASFSSETAQTSTQRRTVDTRGSYVDLDKYNEKYETIASQKGGNREESFTKKQKINQKSQQNKRGQFGKNNRETEAQKLKRLELERARKQQLKVQIPDEIVVSELAQRLKVTATEVIKKLMGLGEMCTINQVIDFDTAALVAEELGAKVEKEV